MHSALDPLPWPLWMDGQSCNRPAPTGMTMVLQSSRLAPHIETNQLFAAQPGLRKLFEEVVAVVYGLFAF